jgi:tetratricopeptide (TPR) repeat protein
MSTHIDNACGDWRRVVYSNLDAARADDKYFAKERNPDAWYVAYRAHNLIVGAYGAMMAGKSREALDMAHRINKILTPEVLSISSPPMANLCESYCTTLPHVMIRFGLWEEILELELPEDKELYSSTVAMISYARGIAFSALRRIPEAEQAHIEFEAAAAAVPEERYNSIPVKEIYALNIATKMIHGELEYRKGNIEKAFMILREGIELEDALPYSDPPAWLQPVRHAYCALNMEQGNYEVAATEYRIELGLDKKLGRRRIRPNNVWSLHGLYECLTKLGRDKEAEEISLQCDIAVASADIPIEASCFCRLSAFEKDACCSNS